MSIPSNAKATLERFAYSPHGTFGRLTVGDTTVFTVERPWLLNRARESCVPEGIYTLRMRHSPVVKRSSGGRYSEGWEVCDVPGRTFIMIHPGNNMYDVIGCIAVGTDLSWIQTSRSPGPVWAVSNSQGAFDEVMEALDAENEWELHIRQIQADYP